MTRNLKKKQSILASYLLLKLYCTVLSNVHPDLHLIMPKPVWVLVVVDPVAIVVEVVHVRDSVVVVVLIDCRRDINDVGNYKRQFQLY